MKRILILLPIISILVSCSLTKEASEENNEVVIIVDGLAYSERFYHEYGKEKWLKLGKEYTVTDGHVTKETIIKFKEKFNSHSIRVIKT